jgi:CubicO group peptidase (beta-lactamase class C family)
MRILLATLLSALLAAFISACGGSGDSTPAPMPPAPPDPWQSVTAAIQAAQSQFPGGLTVELMTPAGVVYSRSFGAFSNANFVPVASASKWVSGSVFMRLVEQGKISLDVQAKTLLVDRQGQPWSGNMGEIRLRHLLSFTSGISGDVLASEDSQITLDEAVKRIYDEQTPTAAAPGTYFFYGSTHMRIAARMAEVATGLTWRQLFDEQLRIPLGWGVASSYGGNANPNPAGTLFCTGLEYTRFLMMQLRQGLDGSTRLLATATIAAQRADGFGPATTITFSPYSAGGRTYHYGFGNWLETSNGQAPSASNPVNRWSSTGLFGWAPWVAADSSYAGLIMTLQTNVPASFLPSEALKATLEPLIRAALASNPPVIRVVP